MRRTGRSIRSLLAQALCPVALVVVASGLSGCGDTLQSKPIPHNILEGMIVSPFPVYWLGDRFQGMQVTEAAKDPSGAYSVQYGNCLQGGEGTCVPPLRVVTSPDNSFVPSSLTGAQPVDLRGVRAVQTNAGRTIAVATGEVVVSVFGKSRATARSAAEAMVAINREQAPGDPLPARLPDSGFGSAPLPSQLPSAVKALD